MSGESAGWHMHVGHPVFSDRDPDRDDACPCLPDYRTPVLVVPMAEAREVMSRALWEHRYRGEWAPKSLSGQIIAAEVNAMLAALAPTSEGGRRDG